MAAGFVAAIGAGWLVTKFIAGRRPACGGIAFSA